MSAQQAPPFLIPTSPNSTQICLVSSMPTKVRSWALSNGSSLEPKGRLWSRAGGRRANRIASKRADSGPTSVAREGQDFARSGLRSSKAKTGLYSSGSPTFRRPSNTAGRFGVCSFIHLIVIAGLRRALPPRPPSLPPSCRHEHRRPTGSRRHKTRASTSRSPCDIRRSPCRSGRG